MNSEERTTSADAESANDPAAVCEPNSHETTTEAVVRALSSVSTTPKTEMEPIYAAVDPDALNSLFGPRENGTPPEFGGHVGFDHASHHVRVESDGTVLVY
ncbi:HalOD1 output domain-containing protein [Halorussus salinisoli]|uniref:HalOD1 output domain-containing protein n=1 Tax=Halorussus salinisoli TaxID=2558242 RepID=UPI0010C219DE|nr:HalOD1 output domain-containing protein [Halorussus salinisoli]